MRLNSTSKGIESKLYFVVFFLFSAFLSLVIYNFAIDTVAGDFENNIFTRNIREHDPDAEGNQIFCTQDAKLCPDGSYVGRVGPNCEFALCPGEVKRPN